MDYARREARGCALRMKGRPQSSAYWIGASTGLTAASTTSCDVLTLETAAAAVEAVRGGGTAGEPPRIAATAAAAEPACVPRTLGVALWRLSECTNSIGSREQRELQIQKSTQDSLPRQLQRQLAEVTSYGSLDNQWPVNPSIAQLRPHLVDEPLLLKGGFSPCF